MDDAGARTDLTRRIVTAAIAAAKLGYRAAVMEPGRMVGGVCINTGTIPSKTIREVVLYLSSPNRGGPRAVLAGQG